MIPTLVITALLLAAAVTDYKKQIIPNSISITIAAVAVLSPNFSLPYSIIGGMLSALLLLIPTYIKTDCFGGGDIKLVAAIGFNYGFNTTLIIICVAILIALITCKLLNLSGRSPLAPHLFVSFVLLIFISAR